MTTFRHHLSLLNYIEDRGRLDEFSNEPSDPVLEVKALAEMMDSPGYFLLQLYRCNSGLYTQPQLFHAWDKARNALVPPEDNDTRIKLDEFFHSILADVNANTLILLNILKLLESNKLAAAIEKSKSLSLEKISHTSKTVENVKAFALNLEETRKLANQGYSRSNEKENPVAVKYDFTNPEKDWTLSMQAAASLDSLNAGAVMDALIKRLYKMYNPFVHKIGLRLAYCLGQSDNFPMDVGLHALPEDLSRIGKLAKKKSHRSSLNVYLTKLVSEMDRPLPECDQSKWVTLRTILLSMMKASPEQSRTLFTQTFDSIRIKGWLRLHFGRTASGNLEEDFKTFKECLWDKLFKTSPLMVEEKETFEKMTAYDKDTSGVNVEVPISSLVEVSSKSKLDPVELNRDIANAVNPARDCVLLNDSATERGIKMHILYKLISDNMIFADHGIEAEDDLDCWNLAEAVLKNGNHPGVKRLLDRHVGLHQSHIFYERNPNHLYKLVLHHCKGDAKYAQALIKMLTDKVVSRSYRYVRKTLGYSLLTIRRDLAHIKICTNYEPFLEKLSELKSRKEDLIKDRNVPEIALNTAIDLVEEFAKSPFTLESCLFAACNSAHVRDHTETVLNLLLDTFSPIMTNTT